MNVDKVKSLPVNDEARALFSRRFAVRLHLLIAELRQRRSARQYSRQSIRAILAEFVRDGREWRLWSKFAWHDLLSRYRRSWVGPLWLMLTASVFIVALGVVYSTLFRMPIVDYVPFVAIGVACWGYISAVTGEGVSVFVEAEMYIRNVRGRLFLYVFRVVWRNTLVFLHYLVVALIVVIAFGRLSPALLPLALLGGCLMLMQGLWIVPLFGLVGTRFRDLQPIVANCLTIAFLVTPIFWYPSMLGTRQWIANLNPLSSMIAIVREPLLGSVPPLGNYFVVALVTIVGSCVAISFYVRFRMRIVYWL